MYHTELQSDQSNHFHTEIPFLDLDLLINSGIVSFELNDRRDAVKFEDVYFPYLNRDVPRSLSYGVYILKPICFAIYVQI